MKVNQLLLELILYDHLVALLLLTLEIQLPQHFHDFSIPFGLSNKLILLRQTLVIVFCQYTAAHLKRISEVYVSFILSYPYLHDKYQFPFHNDLIFLVSVLPFV